MRHATKALRCNGFVDGPNSAGSFYVIFYYTLLWKTCFKCPSREIHSPSGFAVNSNQQRITSSLLSPNTKKAGTDSFSSIPALKPRYPLDNTSFSGCQLFRFRNKISFFGFFILSYPLCFYYLVVCWFILQEHLFLFWFLFVCLHFFDKIDYSVIQIPLIIFLKYKYHVFLSASLRFFSFSLGFLLFVFSSQIRNLWLLLADLKIHSAPNLFPMFQLLFIK